MDVPIAFGSRIDHTRDTGAVGPGPTGPGQFPRRTRQVHRTVFGVDAFVLAVVLSLLILGLAAHLYWDKIFFPDSRYYLVMAYRDMGDSAAGALRTQQKVTGIPAASWYFAGSDPVWRMVQPRLLYPLLSVPFVWLAGPRLGMVVVPALSAVVAVIACARLTQRLYGPAVALFAAGALAASATVTDMVAALTDPLAMALVALLLLNLPIRKRMRGYDYLWLAVLSAALCMTRQTTPVVLGMAAAGAIWALMPARIGGADKPRRPWLLAAAVVSAVTVCGNLVSEMAAPYDATNQFLLAGHQKTMSAAIVHLPQMAWQITRAEAALMVRTDVVLTMVAIGAALYAIIRIREVQAWLLAGAAAGTLALMVANGIPSFLRYESILIPVAGLCSAGLLQRCLPESLLRGSSPSRPVPARRHTPWPVPVSAAAAILLCGSGIAWSATHGSASLTGTVPTAPASAAALADLPEAAAPVRTVSAQAVLRTALEDAELTYENGNVGDLIRYVDWRHPLRYTPAGPGDPGWSARRPDGSAVIRYGDFIELAPATVAAGLIQSGQSVPRSLEVSTRRVSRYGEDVTFTIADRLGHEHRGRATVLYPTQPSSPGTITELVYDS